MAGEFGLLEDRLDLAAIRTRDDPDGNAGRRIPHHPAKRDGDRGPVGAADVPVDPLLDEPPERLTLDAQPATDDRLLGVPRKGAVVVGLGQRTSVLREELGVDREQHGLVVGERPVEVEDQSARGSHPAGSVDV